MGSVASLSLVAELGWWARMSAVMTGTATAGYVTPVIVAYWSVGAAAENSIGFLLGLTSMNLVPAIIGASRWLRCNVGRLLSQRFGINNGDEK